jgi:effector-binding domain-containing protein
MKKFPDGNQYDSFTIERFDNETEKVDIRVYKPGEYTSERFRLPIEGVRNLLTTYRLF